MSPNDFYDKGYTAGQASASACREKIRGLGDSVSLAKFAGKKVEELIDAINSPDLWYVKNLPSWRIGFFDGFCSRAEDLRG